MSLRDAQLTGTLPPSVIGGLPKRDPTTLWHHTQKALTGDSPLFGTVTDLQNLFNSVPRAALNKLLVDFGLPAEFVKSWLDLLHNLKGAVVIQNDYSFPRTASCGIPEGDPMSVVAAVAIGAQLHHVVTNNVSAQPLIYSILITLNLLPKMSGPSTKQHLLPWTFLAKGILSRC